jgi:hypothetical protein
MVGTRKKAKSPPASPKPSAGNGDSGRLVTPTKKDKIYKALSKKSGKPTNVIAAGKFAAEAGYGSKKDSRCKMYFEFLACGIAVAYVTKPNDTEEAFLVHDYKDLNQDMDLKERLKVITICSRRGADGNYVPSNKGSTYPFRQFVLAVHPNTHAQAKKQVKDLMHFLNESQQVSGRYKYPQKIKLMDDYTQSPPRSADARLLDTEVVNMMVACYRRPLEELGEYDEILSEFWTDTEYGSGFINDYLTSAEDGVEEVYEEYKGSDEEEEEEEEEEEKDE